MISFSNRTSKPIRRGIFVNLYKKIFYTKNGPIFPASPSEARRAGWELSVVFAPPALMQKLNKTYRKKDKVADVLSFLLDRRAGEIFLNATEKNLPRLFVHGCLHLKGYDHKNDKDAVKMERLEDKILNS